MSPISLEKIEREAPQLVDLTKKINITLEKKSLSSEVAKVALVLDASRSMVEQYLNGDVQVLLDRIVPIAARFDDDGDLEVWRFSDQCTRLQTATINNIDGYIARHFTDKNIKGGNNEPAAMNAVLEAFKGEKLPVYVIFISDGGVFRSKQIKRLITEISNRGFFWQFVGLGGKNYGILQELDKLEGRVVDNANFFALDDIHSVTPEALYERLLDEYPDWLREARQKKILGQSSKQRAPSGAPEAERAAPEEKRSWLRRLLRL